MTKISHRCKFCSITFSLLCYYYNPVSSALWCHYGRQRHVMNQCKLLTMLMTNITFGSDWVWGVSPPVYIIKTNSQPSSFSFILNSFLLLWFFVHQSAQEVVWFSLHHLYMCKYLKSRTLFPSCLCTKKENKYSKISGVFLVKPVAGDS